MKPKQILFDEVDIYNAEKEEDVGVYDKRYYRLSHTKPCFCEACELFPDIFCAEGGGCFSGSMDKTMGGEMQMDFLELATSRYSVRKYKTDPVEEEKLERILEVGKVAPTAVNFQPQKIYVIRSREAMEKVSSVCRNTFGAPLFLLVCYDEERAWKNSLRENYNSGEVDAAIVATHMMLEAWELGIGSCWIGGFNDLDMANALALPPSVRPVALLALGYPADDARPYRKMHEAFRPMEEMVEEQ